MADVSLKLVVLRTPQVDRLRAFYQALGVELAEERHGNGPLHFTGKVGGVVLEVYPLPGGTADTTTRLGFAVQRLATVVQALQDAGGVVTGGPQQSAWGLRAVVRDPDGRAVELYEA